MSIELKPHNVEAYGKINNKFESGNRVAVVHPMGTGKSYLALKLIEDGQKLNDGEKSVYIAPSNSILHNIKKEIMESGMTMQDFPNLKRITYQKLARMSQEEIDRKFEGTNIVILDEFHHCGAPEWGRGVSTLLAQCPKAKVLGLSATPIRYSDGLRDMSDEFFDENVVSEFTLEEAISKGVLPEATYVSSIYDYDVNELQERINGIEDEEEREKVIEEVGKYIQNQKNVFQKYMNPNGKYIVFCKNIEDMNNKMSKAKIMFENVNSNIEVMGISSDKNYRTNEETLKKFENNKDENTLKLLYAVNMVNEGYRVRDLDGVVMMRPTFSPTIFSQQLGRALSVGNGKEPVVFDLVDNYESCKIIEDFCERMRQYEGRKGNGKDDKNISSGYIKIVDSSKQFKDIVDRIMEISEEAKEYRALIKYRTPSSDEILKLGKRTIEGDSKARQKLIESYLDFSKGVAKDFEQKYGSILPVDLEELQQMATMGIMKAVDSFNINDYKKQDRKMVSKLFRHYMADTIRSSIMEELKETDLECYDKILSLNGESLEENAYDIDVEKFSYEELEDKNRESFINNLPDQQRALETDSGVIAEGIYQEQPDESMEYKVAANSALDQIERLIGAKVDQEQLRKNIDDVLNSLNSNRQRYVLEQRYDLNNETAEGKRTLVEIGKKFHVNNERVRQIEAKALRRVRHPSRSKKLELFMESVGDYGELGDTIQMLENSKLKKNQEKEDKGTNTELEKSIFDINLDKRDIAYLIDNNMWTLGDLINGKFSNKISKSGVAMEKIKNAVHKQGYLLKSEKMIIDKVKESIKTDEDTRELKDITVCEILDMKKIASYTNIAKNNIVTLEDAIKTPNLERKAGSYYEKINDAIHKRGLLNRDETDAAEMVLGMGKLPKKDLEDIASTLKYSKQRMNETQRTELEQLSDKKRTLNNEVNELKQKAQNAKDLAELVNEKTGEKSRKGGPDF